MKNNRLNLCLLCVFLFSIVFSAYSKSKAPKPNIVFVLCDDLGYGDVQCLNPEHGKIATPHIDRLASEGMTFKDAHAGASVCSPTRYGLLTGRYSWRSRLQKGVVQGFKPCLIAPERPTVASFLKEQGYQTAIIGKWHLDFQYVNPETGDTLKRHGKVHAPIGSIIPDGPITRGFDSYLGFHHAADMEAVIQDDKIIEYDPPITMLPRIKNAAVDYIDNHAKDADEPFFLYVAFGSPHTPIVPSPEWQGKSGINPYADFVMQTDAGFGAILDALEKNNLDDNTLVIFSSDNGCSKAANFKQLQKYGHYPSAYMRGSKSDIWDGGHRVPFIVRWPGMIAAGSSNDQTICLTDFFATCADILDQSLPAMSCEDSYSFLPALKGKTDDRQSVIHHSISGHFAYRMGKWKLCLAKGSGGWSSPKESEMEKGCPIGQLYDLESDPGETTNLYDTHPEVVARLLKLLEEDVESGRSTPGHTSTNDVDNIVLWKSGK